MSVYQRTTLVAFCLVVSIGVAACSKKKPAVAPPPPPAPAAPAAPPAPPAPPPAPAPAPAPRPLTEDEQFARLSIQDVQKNFQDVFFALDESTIQDAGKASLSTNADYMKRWTSIRISIEGHCDERGTAEYNMGLGDRRGNAAKEYLVSLGVPASSITVVSKGKEAPFCTDHNESCWQQNRRGHFVVTAK